MINQLQEGNAICFHFLSGLSPVDGNWGAWSDWTECSRLCNGGMRMRFRFCDNPSTKNGGRFCQGERVVEEDCNTEECPGTRRVRLF